MQLNILGIKMIDQIEVGKIIEKATGEKISRGAVCEWLARAGLDGISFKRTKYYSVDLIKDFLRYEKVELRQAIEIVREIKIMTQKKKEKMQKA